MLSKIITITVFAYLAISECEQTSTERADAEESDSIGDTLVVTWPTEISEGFFDIPLNLKDAESEGWTKIKVDGLSSDVEALGYNGDPRFILLYSTLTDAVIAYQIGFPVIDVVGVPIEYGNHSGVTKRSVNDEDYYTSRIYFGKNDDNVFEIWIEYNAEEYMKVPNNSDSMTETPFLTKNCIPTMANPHYYVMNTTTDCSNFFPWFLIGRGKDIVGVGFQAFGNATSASNRVWWESIPVAGVLLAISDTPPCLVDYMDLYDIISLHMWFVNNPGNITCTDA